MLLCSWCDEPATVRLVSDNDARDHTHPACDEHNEMWGRLYRRAVAVSREPALDLRSPGRPHRRDAADRSSPRTVA